MTSFRRFILITGATDGIGRQTALELSASPDNLIIVHGRNMQRCNEAIGYIRAQQASTGQQQHDNLDSVVADFSELRQVADMADEVIRRFPKLNVLLCNAGVLLPKRQTTKDGLEMTFQVNFLAHFLLCTRLLGALKGNQPSRVVVVSSVLHSWHSLDWDDLMAEHKYDKYLQYSRSKLMCHAFALALHRQLVLDGRDYAVTINLVEPGVIDTKLTRHSIEWNDLNSECDYEKYVQYSRTKLMNHLFAFALDRRLRNAGDSAVTCNVLEPGVIETKLLRNGGYSGAPVAEGVKASVYLSQSDDVATTTGCYFSSSAKQITASEESRDEKLQEQLWDVSVEILKQKNVS